MKKKTCPLRESERQVPTLGPPNFQSGALPTELHSVSAPLRGERRRVCRIPATVVYLGNHQPDRPPPDRAGLDLSLLAVSMLLNLQGRYRLSRNQPPGYYTRRPYLEKEGVHQLFPFCLVLLLCIIAFLLFPAFPLLDF